MAADPAGSGAHPSRPALPPFAPYAVLAALALAIYGQTLFFGFLQLDDSGYILNNRFVTGGLSLDSILWAFSPRNLDNVVYYMPLSWLSLILDGTLWGSNPLGYHLTNALLFTLLSFAVFAFAKNLLSDERTALVAAALYAAHPMRVESVAWAAQRKDLLSTLLIVLCLNFYLAFRKDGGKAKYGLALLFALLAAFAKPNAAVIPLLLALIEWFLAARDRLDARATLCRLWPFLLVGAAISAYTYRYSGNISIQLPLEYRLSTMAHAHAYYVWKSLLPLGLYLSESHFQFASISHPLSAAYLLALLAATGLSVAYFRRIPAAAFGWLWFVLALAPTNGFFPTGNILWSDKYTVVAHIGAAIAAASLISSAFKANPKRLFTAGAAIAAALALISAVYAAKWKSDETLFSHILASGGPKGYALATLAADRLQKGDQPGAFGLLEKAVKDDPAYSPTYFMLGTIHQGRGEREKALENYRLAIQYNPEDYASYYNAALIYRELGDLPNAEAYFRLARRYTP